MVQLLSACRGRRSASGGLPPCWGEAESEAQSYTADVVPPCWGVAESEDQYSFLCVMAFDTADALVRHTGGG